MKKILYGMVDKCSKSRYLSKCKNNLANSLLTLKPFRITVVLHKVKDGVTLFVSTIILFMFTA